MMRWWNVTFGILFLAFAVGCTSQKSQQSISRENSHLRWLIRLYVQAGQQGRAPKNEQDLKQFINGMPADSRKRVLTNAAVSAPDELFLSERDGLPYMFFYGTTPTGVADGVIAFEQQGESGRRYVGFSVGIVEEVDEQRFDTLVPLAARNPK